MPVWGGAVWGGALELVSCTRSQSALASVAGSAEGGTAVCWKPGATYVLAELRSATVDALVVSTRLYSTNLWGFWRRASAASVLIARVCSTNPRGLAAGVTALVFGVGVDSTNAQGSVAGISRIARAEHAMSPRGRRR